MPNDTRKVKALITLGEHYNQINRLSRASSCFEDALTVSEKLGDTLSLIKIYTNLGYIALTQYNLDKALSHLSLALHMAENVNDQAGISQSLYQLGGVYKAKGENTQALEFLNKSLDISSTMRDSAIMYNATLTIGYVYENMGDYPTAIKYFNTCRKIAEDRGDRRGMAYANSAVGDINDIIGNFEEAYENYFTAMRLFENLGIQIKVGDMYNSIGVLLYEQHKTQEAQQYFTEAKNIYEVEGDKQTLANILCNMGNVYADEENYAEAIDMMIQALHIYEDLGMKDYTGQVSMNIGTVYNDLGENDKALPYLQKAITINEETGNKRMLGYSYLNLGSVHYCMNHNEEAEIAYQQSLRIFIELQILSPQPQIYFGLIQLDSIKGDFQMAFEHQKLLTALNDSLENESNSQIMTEIRAQYESEKKDKEIMQLENEKQISGLQLKMQQESFQRMRLEKDNLATINLFNQQHIELLDKEKALRQSELDMKNSELTAAKAASEAQRTVLVLQQKEAEIQLLKLNKKSTLKSYLLAGILLLVVLGIFIYSNYITREKLKLQNLRVKIASDLHDDVGSTLSSISIFSEMAQKQSTEVIPLLNTIGESSRKMLDAMADIVWSINPENDQFENLLLRMRSFAYQLLGSKKIRFEFEADDILSKRKLSMEIRKNLYLIFKEAANNMAKYSEAKQAYFSIREDNNALVMLIRDNGKGFDSQTSFTGNGLKNMKRRAAEMGGQLSIDSSSGSGTTIHLRVAI